MLKALKSLFAPKVRTLKYDCLNEFFNSKMEENTNIDSHMSNMNQIYRRLVMNSSVRSLIKIGKSMMLQSLPPSYSAFIGSYVIGDNNDNFHQCLKRLRNPKVEKVAEEIIDLTDICDIQIL
jgi:hypothetical protein